MRNVGKLIKETACVLGGLVAVVGVLIGSTIDFSGDKVLLALYLVGVLLAGWILGLLMFGFGQLVESSDVRTALMLKQAEKEELDGKK